MRKIIFFVVSFYSLMLLLVACGNGEEVLYEQPRFSIRSDIQGVTRTPVLDGDGRGYADASSQNQAACSSLPTIHR